MAQLRPLAPLLAVALLGCGSIEYETGPDHGWRAEEPSAGGDEAITLSVFYEELSPYGAWVDHPVHGRLFVPYDEAYRPYRNGHWVESERGLV
ncbi:MAG TPA: hypothetical protein RMH99_13325 [Sandaracinaceae bacterium LLY-WYZ-13_1]|nr:hypothetical protein [Sandaracinaceae bacterium LLY-WYZ-13_1]